MDIITRGIVDIISRERLEYKLSENRPLRVKFGIDPTAPDIHLGHTVPLQKLKQFQDLGHIIQLVVGDYTAKIGDPSGKSETRQMLSDEQIKDNLETYTTQVFKVLDRDRTHLYFNSEWLGKFTGSDMINLASKSSVQQLLHRRDFSQRLANEESLSVSELLYPLLVGYDSVRLRTDIEIGGTDQLFNFQASKEMQRTYGLDSEVIITLPLLVGTDGVKKMSKSLGNAIGIEIEPFDMYGRIMSISDDVMITYHELLSDITQEGFEAMKSDISNHNVNPMRYKMNLAYEIVGRYHGKGAADLAESKFNDFVRSKNVPENIETLTIDYAQGLSIVQVIKSTGRVDSNSKARNLIKGGGVRYNGEKVLDTDLGIETGGVLQIGKRYFRNIEIKK